jgi:hypothetical protein
LSITKDVPEIELEFGPQRYRAIFAISSGSISRFIAAGASMISLIT